MVTAARIAGHALAAVVVIACVIAWASWTWLSGARWFPPQRCPWRYRPNHHRRLCRCHRPRHLTRPVRATLQTLVALIVLGVVLAPLLTASTLAALALALFGSAAVWRLRLHLDRRVVVTVGKPIPNPRPSAARHSTRPPATTIDPSAAPDARTLAAATTPLLRQLEAAP